MVKRPRSRPRRRCCSGLSSHLFIARPMRSRGGWALDMTPDQVLWVVARVAGLSSYAAMAIAMVTGIAIRTAVLDWVGSNRVLRSLHEYTTVLWIPLAGLHMLSLVLDSTA